MTKAEISTEEAAEVRDRVKEIKKDLYKEKSAIKLDKTGIALIDDMLEYMQSECKKNKIDFELQIKGNIHYMTNNLITKEDLETLLADHIKNAIIAINHTDNVLANKEVRQAINSAINKDEIVKKVYGDRYKVSNFPLDFGNFAYDINNVVIGEHCVIGAVFYALFGGNRHHRVFKTSL